MPEEQAAQLAQMASLHGVGSGAARELGWPRWLLLAFDVYQGAVLAGPGTPRSPPPPGFEVIQRSSGHEWIGQKATPLLRLSDNSFDRLYATVLTSLIEQGRTGGRPHQDRRQANTVISTVIDYAGRR